MSVVRDLPYGPHERHRVDVFAPPGAANADVVLFVHGGAFVRGTKSVNGEIYDNLPLWFARQGVVAVNVEYRLAPEAPYPGGAQDVADAVDWAIGHVAEYGGNAERIFLIGHSAGGAHVATYALEPRFAARRRTEVRGLVLISARLRADALPENPNAGGVRAYFGADPAAYEERSPVTYAERCDLPVFVAIAEYENPLLDVYGLEFAHRVARARGRAPRIVRAAGHNHTSIVAHFNTGEETLGREILAFFATGR